MPEVIFSCEVDTRDPADLESSLRPLLRSLQFRAGRYASERSVIAVSGQDVDWLRLAVGDDIKIERWGIVVGGKEYRHRLDGPAGVLRPSGSGPIETWWLWDQSIGEDAVRRAVAAGVADDREAFEAWHMNGRR